MKTKPNPFLRSTALAASIVLCIAASAHAASLTWDTTIAADGTITAGSGTWTDGAGSWNSGSTSSGVNWSNTNPDSATFAGADGNYTITLGGPITTGGLTFSNSGYTLSAASAQTISMSTVNVAVVSGKTATIGNNAELKSTSGVTSGTLSGGGTLNVTGTGAKLTLGHNLTVSGNSILNIGAGGSVTESVSFIVGDTAGQTGKVTVNGGDFSVGSNLVFTNGSTATAAGQIDLNSGTITVGGNLRYGGASGSGVFNLNGGTLIMSNAASTILENAAAVTSTFNFDGGTLKLGATNTATGGLFGTAGVDNANVKAGGAKFDTNGFNASVAQVLKNGGGADGGLTKLGAGTLTLNGTAVHTFTGGVKVNGGTLALNLSSLGTPTNLVDSSNALSLSGGTLSVTGKSGTNSTQTFTGASVSSGNSAISITKNASTFTTTVALGSITQSTGGVLSIYDNAGAVPATTLAIATASGTTNRWVAPWLVVGDSKTSAARWAYLNASNQLVSQGGTLATASTMDNVTSAATVYTASGAFTAGSALTAFGIQATTASTYALGSNLLTTEGLSAIGGNIGITGTAGIRVGAGNELVLMGNSNISISAPISNKVGSNSNVTYAGGGTVTLDTAVSTYTGLTTVNSGTLALTGTGSIASSPVISVKSGATLNVSAVTGGWSAQGSSSSNRQTLTGAGAVTGATTIGGFGSHNAGDGGVGSQAFSSSLNYANGSIFEWDLNANSTASGFDTVSAVGNITVGTTDTIFKVIFGSGVNLSDPFWSTPSSTKTWSMTSIFGKAFTSGSFASVSSTANPVTQGSFTISGSSLTWTAVPEPTSALAGLLITAGLLRRRRA